MIRFRIFKTKTYEEDYYKLAFSEKQRVDNIVESLFVNADVTGDPLRVPFFREKRLKGKRMLYLVYKNLSAILLVAITDKKTQQVTINDILKNLEEYKLYIELRLKEKTI